MSYQIDTEPPVYKELRALPAHVRVQAFALIDSLADNPRPPRAKELRDRPGVYRIWLAGHWRIVYQIDDDAQLVTILRVRLKDDIDYDSLSQS